MDAEELLRVAGIFYYRSFLEFFFLVEERMGGGEKDGRWFEDGRWGDGEVRLW